MTVLFAASVALLGVLTAAGHTVIGERRIFRPLAREDQRGVLAAPSASFWKAAKNYVRNGSCRQRAGSKR